MRAGVGRLGLIDPDRVELSNLPRQILFSLDDVGALKVDAARARLARLGTTAIDTFATPLHADNAAGLCAGYDFVIDATDDAPTKFLLNDVALAQGIGLSHAGVIGWRGQTFTVLPGRGPCLRCLFGEPPVDAELTCREAGVVGSLAGSLGFLQASQALAAIRRQGMLLWDRMLCYERDRWRSVPLARDPSCRVCLAVTRPWT